MVAGLAAQTLTIGARETALAFGVSAMVFVALILVASLAVAYLDADTFRSVRSTGPTVKRWSGLVLVAVGLWFVTLALVAGPVLL